MRILLPFHLGSGNRGCEGIARGISKIFKLKKDNLILFDISPYDYYQDEKNKLNEIGVLKYTKQDANFEIFRLIGRVFQKIHISNLYNEFMSSYYVNKATEDDVIFITGGDIYCYENGYKLPNLIVKKAATKGIRTVLFGVSMEKDLLNDEALKGLSYYDLIITRETLSHTMLKSLGLNNQLYPDPAFSLDPVKCNLPKYFNKKVIGINFSPFTDQSGLFKKNLENVIDYCLDKEYEVCLIPHVFWKDQDDRKSMNPFLEKYNGRIHMLDSENLSYLEIRYVISQCKYFIGGRTHSVISAYSTNIPCIALGYSVKARGIAKDLGLPDYTIIDSKNLYSENQILEALIKLENDQENITAIYKNIKKYKNKLDKLEDVLNQI